MELLKPSDAMKSTNRRRILTASIATLAASAGAYGQIILTGPQTYTQNFNALGTTTIPWVDGTTVAGWYAGINSNTTADGNLEATDSGTAGANSANSGLLHLGTAGASDRALGSKTTGSSANIAYGVLFRNDGTVPLVLTNATFAGEIWHTNSEAATRETWVTFVKSSDVLFNDTEPGSTSATAAAGTFTALPVSNWTAPNLNTANAAVDGNLAANRSVSSATNPLTTSALGPAAVFINPGQHFMFRWVDTNLSGTDGYQGIDDVSLTFSNATLLTYNLGHSVGAGGPDGTLSHSGGNYWLNGATPSALTPLEYVTFSQVGTATIDVPADIWVGRTSVSATSGTYTLGGAGRIGGALVKSGAGTLSLPTINGFTSVTLSGGTIDIGNAASIGDGPLALSGSGGTLRINADTTIGNPISGTTLTKAGASTLTLTGTTTHTGTTVSEGAVHVASNLSTAHTINVATGTSLRISGTVGTSSSAGISGRLLGTGTVNGLTTIATGGTLEAGFQNAGNITLESLRFGTTAGHTGTVFTQGGSVINVTANNGLTANGGVNTVTINVSGNTPLGATTLINYDGAIGGTGFGAFRLGTLPSRVDATLVNNTTNTSIDLNVTGNDFPIWSGRVSSTWRVGNVGGLENWALNSNNATGTDFRQGDNVLFNDLPASDQTVDISNGDVAPASVTFNNPTHNYTLTGSNGITGNVGIIKSGNATVTITNINSYTGSTTINAGVLSVQAIGDAGINGALGSGIVTLGGGTLEITGGTDVGSKTIVVSAPSTVRVPGGSFVNLTGSVSGSTLTKTGGGTVAFGGTPTNTTLTTTEGTTQIGDGANSGNYNGTIINNAQVYFDRNNDVTTTATLQGNGTYVKRGFGDLTLAGGTVANSFTGTFLIDNGTLIAGKTAGTNAITGNLVVGSGTVFRYGTIAANQNQIIDTATVTVDGGVFGDAGTAPADAAGTIDTVQNIVVNSGTFSTGRATFVATGQTTVNDGRVLINRAGHLNTGSLFVTGPGKVDLDGGTTTAGTELRLTVGAGGITLNEGTINVNFTHSAVAGGSVGSRIVLGGNVTSTGASNIDRNALAGATAPTAELNLNNGVRTFDITDTLTIGSAARPITISSTGGIIKTGTGTLEIPGNHTFTGPVTVNGGTLQFNGNPVTSQPYTINTGGHLAAAGTLAGALTLANGGELTAGVISGGVGSGTLNLTRLTLGTAAGNLSTLNFSRLGTPGIINVTGNGLFTANGGANSVTLNVLGGSPGIGQHLLLDYTGALGGTGFPAFQLGTYPPRTTAALVHDVPNTRILINITSAQSVLWTGAFSNEWSTATIPTPKNWTTTPTPGETDYMQFDQVIFDDTADPLGTDIELNTENVNPGSIRFNNTTLNYTISGTQAIVGAGALVKDGAGAVALQTTNTFTGPVTINAGTLTVGTVTDSGAPGPLGSGNLITLNGGTLEVLSASFTNRPITLTANSTIKADGSLILRGTLNGARTLTKTGPGTLTLDAATSISALSVREGDIYFPAPTSLPTAINVEGGGLRYTGNGAINMDARILNYTGFGGSIGVTQPAPAAAIQINIANGITGNGPIAVEGSGVIRLTAANTAFTGNWSINGGVLEPQVINALGNGTVSINFGGTLAMQAGTAYTLPNNLTLAGGNLQVGSGDTGKYGGTLDVIAPSLVTLQSYTTPANSQNITVSGRVTGDQSITIIGNSPQTNGGNKRLILENPTNTYSGEFIITSGQFLSSSPLTTGTTLGTATVTLEDAGLILLDNGTGNNGLLPHGNNVNINGFASSSIQVGRISGANVGNTIQLGTLNMNGPLLNVTGSSSYKVEFTGPTTLPSNAVISNLSADLILSGSITGAGPLTKTGPNALTLAGSAAISGNILVQQGRLNVNSYVPTGTNVNINGISGAASLGGTGIIADNLTLLASNTSIAPGNSGPGILSIEQNLTMFPGSTLTLDISRSLGTPAAAGTDYDQLNIGTGGPASSTGAVNITGSNLSLNVFGNGFNTTDLFFIIINDGTDPVTGTFANIPAPGTPFFLNGVRFEISYTANSITGLATGGNDIALTIPEPGGAALLLSSLAILARRRRHSPR